MNQVTQINISPEELIKAVDDLLDKRLKPLYKLINNKMVGSKEAMEILDITKPTLLSLVKSGEINQYTNDKNGNSHPKYMLQEILDFATKYRKYKPLIH